MPPLFLSRSCSVESEDLFTYFYTFSLSLIFTSFRAVLGQAGRDRAESKKLNDNDRAGGGGAVAQIMSIIIQFHS